MARSWCTKCTNDHSSPFHARELPISNSVHYAVWSIDDVEVRTSKYIIVCAGFRPVVFEIMSRAETVCVII